LGRTVYRLLAPRRLRRQRFRLDRRGRFRRDGRLGIRRSFRRDRRLLGNRYRGLAPLGRFFGYIAPEQAPQFHSHVLVH
jgi:hypothetical protein